MENLSNDDPPAVHIECCTNCNTHSWCTRHDEQKYHNVFLAVKKAISMRNPELQIKLNEVPSHLKPSKKDSSDNRFYDSVAKECIYFPSLGAFQVKYMNILIFSKHESQAWPDPQQIASLIVKVKQEIQKSGNVERYKRFIHDGSSHHQFPEGATEEQLLALLEKNPLSLFEFENMSGGKNSKRRLFKNRQFRENFKHVENQLKDNAITNINQLHFSNAVANSPPLKPKLNKESQEPLTLMFSNSLEKQTERHRSQKKSENTYLDERQTFYPGKSLHRPQPSANMSLTDCFSKYKSNSKNMKKGKAYENTQKLKRQINSLQFLNQYKKNDLRNMSIPMRIPQFIIESNYKDNNILMKLPEFIRKYPNKESPMKDLNGQKQMIIRLENIEEQGQAHGMESRQPEPSQKMRKTGFVIIKQWDRELQRLEDRFEKFQRKVQIIKQKKAQFQNDSIQKNYESDIDGSPLKMPVLNNEKQLSKVEQLLNPDLDKTQGLNIPFLYANQKDKKPKKIAEDYFGIGEEERNQKLKKIYGKKRAYQHKQNQHFQNIRRKQIGFDNPTDSDEDKEMSEEHDNVEAIKKSMVQTSYHPPQKTSKLEKQFRRTDQAPLRQLNNSPNPLDSEKPSDRLYSKSVKKPIRRDQSVRNSHKAEKESSQLFKKPNKIEKINTENSFKNELKKLTSPKKQPSNVRLSQNITNKEKVTQNISDPGQHSDDQVMGDNNPVKAPKVLVKYNKSPKKSEKEQIISEKPSEKSSSLASKLQSKQESKQISKMESNRQSNQQSHCQTKQQSKQVTPHGQSNQHSQNHSKKQSQVLSQQHGNSQLKQPSKQQSNDTIQSQTKQQFYQPSRQQSNKNSNQQSNQNSSKHSKQLSQNHSKKQSSLHQQPQQSSQRQAQKSRPKQKEQSLHNDSGVTVKHNDKKTERKFKQQSEEDIEEKERSEEQEDEEQHNSNSQQSQHQQEQQEQQEQQNEQQQGHEQIAHKPKDVKTQQKARDKVSNHSEHKQIKANQKSPQRQKIEKKVDQKQKVHRPQTIKQNDKKQQKTELSRDTKKQDKRQQNTESPQKPHHEEHSEHQQEVQHHDAKSKPKTSQSTNKKTENKVPKNEKSVNQTPQKQQKQESTPQKQHKQESTPQKQTPQKQQKHETPQKTIKTKQQNVRSDSREKPAKDTHKLKQEVGDKPGSSRSQMSREQSNKPGSSRSQLSKQEKSNKPGSSRSNIIKKSQNSLNQTHSSKFSELAKRKPKQESHKSDEDQEDDVQHDELHDGSQEEEEQENQHDEQNQDQNDEEQSHKQQVAHHKKSPNKQPQAKHTKQQKVTKKQHTTKTKQQIENITSKNPSEVSHDSKREVSTPKSHQSTKKKQSKKEPVAKKQDKTKTHKASDSNASKLQHIEQTKRQYVNQSRMDQQPQEQEARKAVSQNKQVSNKKTPKVEDKSKQKTNKQTKQPEKKGTKQVSTKQVSSKKQQEHKSENQQSEAQIQPQDVEDKEEVSQGEETENQMIEVSKSKQSSVSKQSGSKSKKQTAKKQPKGNEKIKQKTVQKEVEKVVKKATDKATTNRINTPQHIKKENVAKQQETINNEQTKDVTKKETKKGVDKKQTTKKDVKKTTQEATKETQGPTEQVAQQQQEVEQQTKQPKQATKADVKLDKKSVNDGAKKTKEVVKQKTKQPSKKVAKQKTKQEPGKQEPPKQLPSKQVSKVSTKQSTKGVTKKQQNQAQQPTHEEAKEQQQEDNQASQNEEQPKQHTQEAHEDGPQEEAEKQINNMPQTISKPQAVEKTQQQKSDDKSKQQKVNKTHAQPSEEQKSADKAQPQQRADQPEPTQDKTQQPNKPQSQKQQSVQQKPVKNKHKQQTKKQQLQAPSEIKQKEQADQHPNQPHKQQDDQPNNEQPLQPLESAKQDQPDASQHDEEQKNANTQQVQHEANQKQVVRTEDNKVVKTAEKKKHLKLKKQEPMKQVLKSDQPETEPNRVQCVVSQQSAVKNTQQQGEQQTMKEQEELDEHQQEDDQEQRDEQQTNVQQKQDIKHQQQPINNENIVKKQQQAVEKLVVSKQQNEEQNEQQDGQQDVDNHDQDADNQSNKVLQTQHDEQMSQQNQQESVKSSSKSVRKHQQQEQDVQSQQNSQKQLEQYAHLPQESTINHPKQQVQNLPLKSQVKKAQIRKKVNKRVPSAKNQQTKQNKPPSDEDLKRQPKRERSIRRQLIPKDNTLQTIDIDKNKNAGVIVKNIKRDSSRQKEAGVIRRNSSPRTTQTCDRAVQNDKVQQQEYFEKVSTASVRPFSISQQSHVPLQIRHNKLKKGQPIVSQYHQNDFDAADDIADRAAILKNIYFHDKKQLRIYPNMKEHRGVFRDHTFRNQHQQRLPQLFTQACLFTNPLGHTRIFGRNSNLTTVLKILCDKSQNLIRRLFEQTELSRNGMYGIWICCKSGWRSIIIDDYVPVDTRNRPIFLSSSDQSIWAPLLQKALAKASGGYQQLHELSICQIFKMLTGSNYLTFKVKEDPTMNHRGLKWIHQNEKKNYIIQAQRHKTDENTDGFPQVFYVNRVKNIDQQMMVHLRTTREDGFWIKMSSFCQQFKQVNILKLRQNYKHSHYVLDVKPSTYCVVQIAVPNISSGAITVHHREVVPAYTKTILYREQQDNLLRLVGTAKEKNKEEINFDCQLLKGHYYVFIDCGQQPTKVNLAYFGQEQVKFRLSDYVQSRTLKNDKNSYIPVDEKESVLKSSDAQFRQTFTKSNVSRQFSQQKSMRQEKMEKVRKQFLDYLLNTEI